MNPQETPATIQNSQPIQKSKNNFLVMFLVIILIILLGASVYLFYENQNLNKKLLMQIQPALNTPQTQTIEPTGSVINNPDEWFMAGEEKVFSYDYPKGWNVAEIWENNNLGFSQNPIYSIYMDSKPLDFSPGDSPVGTFVLHVFNGLQNPNAIVHEARATMKESSYSNIQSDIINTVYGPVYHYTANIAGEFRNGTPVEKYIFTFESSPNDPLNQQVIVAEKIGEYPPEMSDIMRHIVLSIKPNRR